MLGTRASQLAAVDSSARAQIHAQSQDNCARAVRKEDWFLLNVSAEGGCRVRRRSRCSRKPID
jgi:hypothetical protein